jgi:hypothetical protein
MTNIQKPNVQKLTPEQIDNVNKGKFSRGKIPANNKLWYPYKGPWEQIVTPLIERCNTLGLTIWEIKEKWGSLRFTTGSVDESFTTPDFEAIHVLQNDIENACSASYTLCEICCQPGKGRNNGHHVFVACDEHAIKR